MPNRSFDIFEPETTVSLSPFAVIRNSGEICDGSRSAVRSLQIVELISKAGQPLRAIEIAKALNISPSTLSQILKSMVDAAYLIFDQQKKTYYPSTRIGTIGENVSREYFGIGRISALMKSVEGLANTAQLSTSQGQYMQVLNSSEKDAYAQIDTNSAHSVGRLVGVHVPLFGSCIGAAWLSVQTDRSVVNAARLCRRELGARANDLDAIMHRLQAIRLQGYAFGGISENEEDMSGDAVRTIAMPLPATANGIVLVIAIAGSLHYIEQNREKLAAQMKQCVSNALALDIAPHAPDVPPIC